MPSKTLVNPLAMVSSVEVVPTDELREASQLLRRSGAAP